MSWPKPAPNPHYDIAGLRRRLGWTQSELAKAVHSTERSVRRWERDGMMPQRPYYRRLRQIEDERFGSPRPLPRRKQLPGAVEPYIVKDILPSS